MDHGSSASCLLLKTKSSGSCSRPERTVLPAQDSSELCRANKALTESLQSRKLQRSLAKTRTDFRAEAGYLRPANNSRLVDREPCYIPLPGLPDQLADASQKSRGYCCKGQPSSPAPCVRMNCSYACCPICMLSDQGSNRQLTPPLSLSLSSLATSALRAMLRPSPPADSRLSCYRHSVE